MDTDSMHPFRALPGPSCATRTNLLHRARQFFDVYSEQTCVALPVYSDKPVVVSLAFARSSMRSVPGGSTHYREFSAEQHMLRRAHKRPRRYLFVLNEKFLPTGVSLACLIKRRKSVALQTGVEDNTRRVASAGSPGDPSQTGGPVDGVRRLSLLGVVSEVQAFL